MKKIALIFELILLFLLVGCFNETTTTKKEIITISKTNASTTSAKENITTKELEYGDVPVKVIENVSDNSKIYISAFNDTHGQLFRNGDYLGMSEVAGIIGYNEEKYNQSYIKIANGDIFQGSYISRLTDGECFIDALNSMDITAMVLGNHEFDWTLDTIHDYWDGDLTNGEANFPLLCCNLIDSETGKRPDWVKPHMVVEYGDIKVGIIGAIGSEEESDISPSSLGTYYFDPIASYYKESCKELRALGCDFIIFSVHDENDLYSDYVSYKKDLCPDAIIYGHTHRSIDGYYTRIYDNYSVPYIQSYTKSLNIGEIIINIDYNSKKSLNASINHYNAGYYDYYVKNPSEKVENILKNKYYETHLEGLETIYECSYERELSSKAACADFACKIMNEMFDGYVSFLNSGGVRTTFNKKEITKADIFELFPFDNKIVKARMTGENLKKYLNTRSDLLFNYSFDEWNINDSEVYTILTVDYVATGANELIRNYCINNEYEVTDYILRDTLVDYLKK